MAATETKFVAFIDILGFSQLIKTYDDGKDEKILNLLKQAIDPAATFMRESFELAKGGPFYAWKDCLDIRLFSDCLCAAAPLSYKGSGFIDQLKFFYKYLMGYQSLLMENGFFTRGGVAIGSHYADENIIFSGGLVEAHDLECKYAVHPRIILSKGLIAQIEESQAGEEESINYMLMRDKEGTVFFNHFNHLLIDSAMQDKTAENFLKLFGSLGMTDKTFFETDIENKQKAMSNIRQICEQKIKDSETEHIRDKYRWLIEFIDFEFGKNNSFQYFNS
jgi:hypothetical protein